MNALRLPFLLLTKTPLFERLEKRALSYSLLQGFLEIAAKVRVYRERYAAYPGSLILNSYNLEITMLRTVRTGVVLWIILNGDGGAECKR